MATFKIAQTGVNATVESTTKWANTKQFGKLLAKAAMASTQGIAVKPSRHYLIDTSLPRAESERPADRQLRRLYTMKCVKDGWAGSGSLAPTHESIERAAELIKRFSMLPFPMPMASVSCDGHAGLSWSDSKLYADIEILEDGKIGYLVQVKGGVTFDDEVDMPAVGLPSEIGRALTSAYFENK